MKLAAAVEFFRNDPEMSAELAPVAAELEDLAANERPISEFSWRSIYVDERARYYDVFYDVLDEVGNASQTSKRFRRHEVHDVGSGEFVSALEAARRFKTAREVERALGRSRSRELTLDDAWKRYAERKRRPNTKANDAYAYGKHIAPHLGRFRLKALTPAIVEDWYEHLEAGPEARKKAGRLLRAVVRHAHRRGEVSTDPTTVLRIPASKVRAIGPDEVPTPADVRRLADDLEGADRVAVLLMGFAGLRPNEAFGLRVRDVHLERSALHVARTVSEVGGLTHGPPKTARGDRWLTLPAFLVREIAPLVDGRELDEPLIESPRGGVVRLSNWRERTYAPAAARARIAVSPHGLRHAAASSWIEQGASATAVAYRLGDDVATVLRVYARSFPSEDVEIARRQDAAFGA